VEEERAGEFNRDNPAPYLDKMLELALENSLGFLEFLHKRIDSDTSNVKMSDWKFENADILERVTTLKGNIDDMNRKVYRKFLPIMGILYDELKKYLPHNYKLPDHMETEGIDIFDINRYPGPIKKVFSILDTMSRNLLSKYHEEGKTWKEAYVGQIRKGCQELNRVMGYRIIHVFGGFSETMGNLTPEGTLYTIPQEDMLHSLKIYKSCAMYLLTEMNFGAGKPYKTHGSEKLRNEAYMNAYSEFLDIIRANMYGDTGLLPRMKTLFTERDIYYMALRSYPLTTRHGSVRRVLD